MKVSKMKNLILSFSIVVFLFIGCKNEVVQSQVFQKNLLHKTYSNPNNYTEYFYNPSDKIIRVQSFNNDKLERETNFEYDKNGNIIKETTFTTSLGVPQYSSLTYEYDEQNLLSKTFAYWKMSDDNYELRSTTKYEYDANKRLLKTRIFAPDNVEKKLTELFYDDNGNIIEKNFYQDGKLSFNDKYEYDNMNNPLRQNTAGTSVYNINRNNVIKHIQINFMLGNDNSISEFIYEYNSDGYPTSYTFNSQKFYFQYY
jgi:YD repeat-containing protein